ncbi:DUF3379 family protein [Psychromonas antarctica]|uniref:DUF3379 family protein n=1 Tax=Psychromonas antarctica TaxID=67573 RepID=UPI001EE85BAA|nr:DUF3379 family protein [Psychromonas antarctica]MCG6202589.1 DUF3379 domain-containing protein [Psychromonas antarctica]
MDDILFRHTAIATPNYKGDEFLQRQAESEKNKSLVNEAKQFDLDLQSLLKVDLPENLADKILFQQYSSINHKRQLNNRWHIAIAASIAFVIGISLPLLNGLTHSPLDIGTVAMQHVQQEYYFTAKINEQASRTTINAKLASYGGQVQGELGEVFFVNYCQFAGTSALHMIMQGEKGRVTVFVVPAGEEFIETPSFNNQHLKGVTKKMGHANVVIVGERDEPLEKMDLKLQKNIQWDI